jgi:acetyl esterase
VRGLAALPPRLQLLLAGRKPLRIDGQVMEPDVQLLLRLMMISPRPSFETLPLVGARQQLRDEAATVTGRPLEVARVEQLHVPGAEGELGARLYVPIGAAPRGPLLLYLHGGGWVVCDLDTHDQVCRFLAREAGVRVLSLDYRRAPEHRFPAAVEDVMAALRFCVDEAERLGADPQRIAIGGDSAGGNLAAVAAQLATRDGGPAPAFQLLIYPVTDLSSKHRSYGLFSEGFFLTEQQMDWYRDKYLPDAEAALDPRASPLLAEDLGGLPPTHVAIAGFDVLRDEIEEYVRRLEQAGVSVTVTRATGSIHGFCNGIDVGRSSLRAMRSVAAALRTGLAAEELKS